MNVTIISFSKMTLVAASNRIKSKLNEISVLIFFPNHPKILLLKRVQIRYNSFLIVHHHNNFFSGKKKIL
jgi:hypothetical protein